MPEKKYLFFSSKKQLYLSLFILSIISGLYAYGTAQNWFSNQNGSDLKKTAKLSALVLDRQFITLKDLSSIFADKIVFSRLVKEGRWEEAMASANALTAIGTDNFVRKVSLLSTDGVVKAESTGIGGSLVGRDSSSRDYFKGASSDLEPYVSEVYRMIRPPQDKVFSISVPIEDTVFDNVPPIGILNMAIDVNSFMRWLDEIAPKGETSVYVVDQYGKLVAHSRTPGLWDILDYSGVPAVQMVMKGNAGSETYTDPIDGKRKFVAWEPVPTSNWGVVV